MFQKTLFICFYFISFIRILLHCDEMNPFCPKSFWSTANRSKNDFCVLLLISFLLNQHRFAAPSGWYVSSHIISNLNLIKLESV